MKPNIIYICGLFETSDSFLSKKLKKFFEESGYNLKSIELYPNKQFGSYSFQKELERIQKIVEPGSSSFIIAHSLGAYLALQLKKHPPLFLLDPSLTIKDIVCSNLQIVDGKRFYVDENEKCELSSEFIQALERTPSIDDLGESLKANTVFIISAGRGGYKISEQYRKYMPDSSYFLLEDADHDFSDKENVEEVVSIIKKQLG